MNGVERFSVVREQNRERVQGEGVACGCHWGGVFLVIDERQTFASDSVPSAYTVSCSLGAPMGFSMGTLHAQIEKCKIFFGHRRHFEISFIFSS